MLGIPLDASDGLVRFAYRKQVERDPGNAHHYLTYLIQIAEGRSSDLLLTEVAIERSSGKFDYRQLTEAYRYFGFYVETPSLDDAHIIGTFQSRLEDAPKHESQMREHLKLIGTHRNSRKILNIAEDCKNTHSRMLE